MSKQIENSNPLAYLVHLEDGWHVRDLDGNLGPVCPENVGGGGYSIKLSKNDANRTYYSTKKAYKDFEANPDGIPLYATEKTPLGSVGTKLPNAKLIAYLPEDLQAEYKAIIDRAREAMEADRATRKKQPMTEEQKLRNKIAKAQAALAALIEEAGE